MLRIATWKTFPCLAALLLWGSAAWADYEAGQAAWKAGQYAEALTQWEAAARTGDDRAMLALGRVFVKGLGVPQDYVLAHKWLNLAAGRGNEDAAAEREALAVKMAPQQIALAQEQARTWRSSVKMEAPKAAVPKTVASSPPTAPPPKRTIREAQKLMAELGYKPGPADGLWGSRSAKAYAAFLRDAGMPPGEMLTLDALRAMRTRAAEEKAPGAVAKAGAETPSTRAESEARAAGPARPAPKCTAWNTEKFFEAATPEIVTRCLRGSSDPNARGKGGRTPLHLAAAWSGSSAVIDVLAKAGADPNAREEEWNDTPLHFAAWSDNNPAAIIDALVKAGADLSAENRFGTMPLDLAARRGNAPATTGLVKAGLGGRPQESLRYHPTARGRAVPKTRMPCPPLLNAGADPNARYRNGATPLHWAAPATGSPAIIAALLKAGADPNARDKEWEPPLHWAASLSRNPTALDALLKGGADPNARE